MISLQKILRVAGVLVLLTFLFPPFHGPANYESAGLLFNFGYSFIFLPPENGRASVDIGMLLIEWTTIFLLAGILWIQSIANEGGNGKIFGKRQRKIMIKNFRLGFFRVWVLFSVAFIILYLTFSFGAIKNEFEKDAANRARWSELGFTELVPVERSKARGDEGKDYFCHSDKSVNDYVFKKPDVCAYQLPKFRKLYPEYNDLSDEKLSDKLYEEIGQPLKHTTPWTLLLGVLAIAFGVPLLVLAIGGSLVWVINRFRQREFKNVVDALHKTETSTSDTDKQKKKKSSFYWLLWWNIDNEQLSKEVAEYDTIKLFKSSRGGSIGCLLLSAAVTVAFVFFGALDSGYLPDAIIMIFLCAFIYMRHRWAMIAAMVLWTLDKGYSLTNGIGTVAPNPIMQIIWWCIYMHVFYMAFRVEQEKRKLGQSVL